MSNRSRHQLIGPLSIWQKPRGSIRQFAHAISTGAPGNLDEEDTFREILETLLSGFFDGRMSVVDSDIRRADISRRDWYFLPSPLIGENIRIGLVRCLSVTHFRLRSLDFKHVSELTNDEYRKILATGILDRVRLETGAVLDWLASRQTVIQSGLPGPPTSKHLVLMEAERRLVAGEIPATLVAFAKGLSDWLKDNHPVAPQMGPRRAENVVRKLWHAMKSAAIPKPPEA